MNASRDQRPVLRGCPPASQASALCELANPVLTACLDEFDAGLNELRHCKPTQREAVSRRLCQLSREFRFRLGQPSEAPKETLERVLQLLDDAVQAMMPKPDQRRDPCEIWRSNIAERAEDIRRARNLG